MSPSPVNYFEIGTPNSEASRKFYGELFDWQIADIPKGGYGMIDVDRGGMWDTAEIGGGSWAIFYVQVEDVEATVRKAVELGGEVIMPLTSNPQLEFAHLIDNNGHRFGVWKPKES